MDSRVRDRDRLLSSLLSEVYAAQRAVAEQTGHEGDRLLDTPPAQAMHALARACDRAADELFDIEVRPPLSRTARGPVASVLDGLRARMGDALASSEAMYRATLLEVHRSIDSVLMLRAAADDAGYPDVVEWCMRALDAQLPLLEQAQHDLRWFGLHAERAIEPAHDGAISKGARLATSALAVLGLRRA
jgi:hypothetical protein